MKNETYNGWTNYATWRVNSEIFSDLKFGVMDEPMTGEDCRRYAEDEISWGVTPKNFKTYSYALAFMWDVNWEEIAESLNEQ